VALRHGRLPASRRSPAQYLSVRHKVTSINKRVVEQLLINIFGPHLAQAVIVLLLISTAMFIASRLILHYHVTMQKWGPD
jgi:hypothetical protein